MYIILFFLALLVAADLAYIIVHHLKPFCQILPCSQQTVSSWIEYLAKLDENTYFKCKRSLYKKSQDSATSSFISCFTPNHLYKFLERHSTLCEES